MGVIVLFRVQVVVETRRLDIMVVMWNDPVAHRNGHHQCDGQSEYLTKSLHGLTIAKLLAGLGNFAVLERERSVLVGPNVHFYTASAVHDVTTYDYRLRATFMKLKLTCPPPVRDRVLLPQTTQRSPRYSLRRPNGHCSRHLNRFNWAYMGLKSSLNKRPPRHTHEL